MELHKKGIRIDDSLQAMCNYEFQCLCCIWSGFYNAILKPLFTQIQMNSGIQVPLINSQLNRCLLILDIFEQTHCFILEK